ncbi:MAG: phosphorylase [Alphaproteobacteria bacterium]|nr:phosphorylase [Alphaproteobacteria bacterium]
MAAVGVVTGMAAEAERLLSGNGLPRDAVAVAGPSAVAAEATARELLAAGARGLVSFGLAAGLHPTLKAGIVVLATEVVTPEGEVLATQTLWRGRLAVHLRRGGPLLEARLAGVDRPVVGVDQKAALLASSGAAAADMESHGVARAARAANVPFIVVRAVADAADRVLPQAALTALRPDGRVAYGRLLRRLLGHPGELRGLAGLAIDSWFAFAALRRAARYGRRDLLFPG